MENKFNIEKFPTFDFTFDRWSAGSYADLGLLEGPRWATISKIRNVIRQYAIGYCNAETIAVRPKLGCVGVMFFKDGKQFWFHLMNREFKVIFPEISDYE